MFLFLDTETTGLNKATHRVVQIAWVLADDIGRVAEENNNIIRPDGFSIPQSATAIHGITTQHARSVGRPLRGVLEELADAASKASCVVAHNASFDLGFLKSEYPSVGLNYPFSDMPIVCTMMSSVSVCRLQKLNGMPGFKRPTLQELHFHLIGKYFDGAHDALADVHACMRCFYELKRQRLIGLPREKDAGTSVKGKRANTSSSLMDAYPGEVIKLGFGIDNKKAAQCSVTHTKICQVCKSIVNVSDDRCPKCFALII